MSYNHCGLSPFIVLFPARSIGNNQISLSSSNKEQVPSDLEDFSLPFSSCCDTFSEFGSFLNFQLLVEDVPDSPILNLHLLIHHYLLSLQTGSFIPNIEPYSPLWFFCLFFKFWQWEWIDWLVCFFFLFSAGFLHEGRNHVLLFTTGFTALRILSGT